MIQLEASVIILYLVLKGFQWVTGPRESYASAYPGVIWKLKRGEPWLLIVASTLPLLAYLYGHWWSERRATRAFSHATDCIGRLESLGLLPNAYRQFRRKDVADRALGYYGESLDWGARLKLDVEEINRIVNRSQAAYAVRYAGLARMNARATIDAEFGSIDRCLKDEWPHDGLLNP